MLVSNIHGKAWLALKSRLDMWSETRIHLPFSVFTPTANEAFIVVDPATLEYDAGALGYECGDDHRGFLNLRVMTPVSEWDYAASSGLLGRVAALFPAGLIMDYADAQVTIYQQPKAIGTVQLEAAWNRQDLRVYWRAWG